MIKVRSRLAVGAMAIGVVLLAGLAWPAAWMHRSAAPLPSSPDRSLTRVQPQPQIQPRVADGKQLVKAGAGGAEPALPDLAEKMGEMGIPVGMNGEVQMSPAELLEVLANALPPQPERNLDPEEDVTADNELAVPDRAAAAALVLAHLTNETRDPIRVVNVHQDRGAGNKLKWVVKYVHDRPGWSSPVLYDNPELWVDRETGEVTTFEEEVARGCTSRRA